MILPKKFYLLAYLAPGFFCFDKILVFFSATSETDETEDELWSLLDIIHRKGTRLKDEVEALQGTLRDQTPFGDPDGNFQRDLFHSSADDVRQLRQERDLLLDR